MPVAGVEIFVRDVHGLPALYTLDGVLPEYTAETSEDGVSLKFASVPVYLAIQFETNG